MRLAKESVNDATPGLVPRTPAAAAARCGGPRRVSARLLVAVLGIVVCRPVLAELLNPALLATPLRGLDQREHRVDDWRGRYRVLNFWATWCQPCRQETAWLQAGHREWREAGGEIIGIALDDADAVSGFARQAGIDYPLLLAGEPGVELMRVAGNRFGGLPFTLLIDGQGRVLQRHAGPLDRARLQAWLRLTKSAASAKSVPVN